MPKLLALSGREACKIMAKHGFQQVRQKGGHLIMQRKEGNTTITVPVPDHDELRMGHRWVSSDILAYLGHYSKSSDNKPRLTSTRKDCSESPCPNGQLRLL